MPDEENQYPPPSATYSMVPIPDPTKLTTEAMSAVTVQYRLDIEATKKLLEQRLISLESMLNERYATQTKALDAAFVAAEKAVSTALHSAEKAVSKAEIANERRFESVNGFRAQMADQQSSFVTREEHEAKMEALQGRVYRNESSVERLQGSGIGSRQTMATFLTAGAIVVTIIIAVATIVFTR
jgi:hypothetical protein